ncbi:hypothetical protein EDB89DRAFT_2115688 [Lactarius sanguifluus]|nr:hypothetical protein EDB89DRAFT_2115688 [Lactarius sanguifluus]
MPTTKPTAPRKRNRKRKRRLASSSSSSSSSDPASSDETPIKKAPLKKQATPSSAEEPSSSSSSSPSSSDSEDNVLHESNALPLPAVSRVPFVKTQGSGRVMARSPSPSPPPVDLPPFLSSEGSSGRTEEEQALRNRFRQFWMASVADAFSDDLERIRKEPSMTKSRLALLIDSLASGGEVFSSRAGERGEMNEMEVVLNSNHDD